MTGQIIRVWGRADEFDIEFTHGDGNTWTAHVPPDLSDGQYAVEIHAINDTYGSAYWAGILYMSQGVGRICLKQSNFDFWLVQPQCVVNSVSDRFSLSIGEKQNEMILKTNEITVALLNGRLSMAIKEECRK